MSHQFAEENFPPEIQHIADRMNIDPERIPPYELPPLPIPEGCSPSVFLNRVRPALLRIMEENLYGPIPPRCEELIFRKRSEGRAFEGLAVRREIDIVCRNRRSGAWHETGNAVSDQMNLDESLVPVYSVYNNKIQT